MPAGLLLLPGFQPQTSCRSKKGRLSSMLRVSQVPSYGSGRLGAAESALLDLLPSRAGTRSFNVPAVSCANSSCGRSTPGKMA